MTSGARCTAAAAGIPYELLTGGSKSGWTKHWHSTQHTLQSQARKPALVGNSPPSVAAFYCSVTFMFRAYTTSHSLDIAQHYHNRITAFT